MKPYFDTASARERLRYHALKWLGTPFVPHAAVCGAGVDCVNLCAQIYLACGFLSAFKPPAYTMDGGKHNPESQLTRFLDAMGRFERLEIGPPAAWLPGDLLCFKTGRSAHHTGLVLDPPHFIHCLYGRTVMPGTLADRTFQRLLVAAYRPIQTEAGA